MFENENILVIGLGVSGVASIKALKKLNTKKILVYDQFPRKNFEEKIKSLQDIDVEYYFDEDEINLNNVDLVIKSPGIKYNIDIIEKIISKHIDIISDAEAAYLNTEAKIVSITGTNGKTTTTTLIGEIVNSSNKKCTITGNIGFGMFYDAVNSSKEDILIAELSSFQLDGTKKYKPHIAVITNITPDHLDWHGNLNCYINAKFKNFVNQDEDDYAILNYDDLTIREFSKNIKGKVIFFSAKANLENLENSLYVENKMIIYKNNKEKIKLIHTDEIFMPGKHSLENILASCATTLVLGIDIHFIKETIKHFKGVEHRLEFCGQYKDMKFYNDSKGTNPDASIKAVEGIKKPIILIAGGYDKNSYYDDFIKSFEDKVKALILMGQTADKIEEAARKYGFEKIYKVRNMDEAVKKCFILGEKGDNVVLSPACASWGMYPNYEVRGKDFKERVIYYGECSKEID